MTTCASYFYREKVRKHSAHLKPKLADSTNLFSVEYGPYFNHLLSFWNQRHLENILIITYEDMKRDLSGVIEKVASFLGKSVGEKDLPKLVDHLSFAKMKDNRAVNYKSFVETSVKDGEIDPEVAEKKKFMRAGRVGSYKEEMSEEMNEMFDRWIEKNVSGTDFPGWSL